MRIRPWGPGNPAVWLLIGIAVGATACDDPPAPPAPEWIEGDRECVEEEPGVAAGLARFGLLENASYYRCQWPAAGGGAYFRDLALDDAVLTGIPMPVSAVTEGASSLRGQTVLVSGGSDGFYALRVEAETDTLRGELLWNEALPSGNRSVRFAILSEGTDLQYPLVGETLGRSLYLVKVGSGDIQINLRWSKKVDLDLHVIDPTGFEIYFGDTTSPSGGNLDLDSYAACLIEGDRGRGNENVFWPDESAPRGAYRVRVNLYDACGVNEVIPYRVIVVQDRTRVQTFQGMFDPARDVGETHDVATFTR